MFDQIAAFVYIRYFFQKHKKAYYSKLGWYIGSDFCVMIVEVPVQIWVVLGVSPLLSSSRHVSISPGKPMVIAVDGGLEESKISPLKQTYKT